MGKSLAEQIADIANKPVNRDFDIEDDERAVFGHSNADGSDSGSDSGSDGEGAAADAHAEHYVDVGKSKLRAAQEVVQDEKYEGTVGSREKLFGDSGEVPEADMESSAEEEEQEEDELISESESEGSVVSDSEEEEEQAQDARREQLAKLVQQERDYSLNKLSQTAKRDAAKGYSVMQQTKLFDGILDVRIKMQKVLNAANGMPLTEETWDKELDKENKKLLKKNRELLSDVFQQLVAFRSAFQHADHISQEERVPSESSAAKRSFAELQEDTSKLDSDLKTYRAAVLDKWSTKISSASGSAALQASKFKAINQSADVQVENQLADMTRLVKRTRLNRRNIVPLNFSADYKSGKLSEFPDAQGENDNNGDDEDDANPDIPKNYDPRRKDNHVIDTTENPYIFDDEDFYRVLLNDLIDKKISDNNNLQGGNNIMTITSRSNNKLKKNIDTKASKGRKLNYTVQEPIANYEAPVDGGYKWSDEQIDEFFAGLLGQRINFDEDESAEDVESEELSDEEKQAEAEAIKNDHIQIFG
ncbi:rRNA-processing protein [Maudiozyma humilis]|uniref:Protein BFR2 n=1 Tax=Maudiozyma humilis TaxID=51915 RepID=A0AAV5S5M9_MAUHU|nr:rRNA-processing protein [Kazachstania humilis]